MLRCFRKFSCYNINMNIPIDWDKIDATVKEFGFDGESKEAKIVSVYDGDTVKVVFPVFVFPIIPILSPFLIERFKLLITNL